MNNPTHSLNKIVKDQRLKLSSQKQVVRNDGSELEV